jgi:DNA uptake protein ComE-like DNA-binding protein
MQKLMPRLFSFLRPKKASILIVSLWAFTILSILSLSLAGFVFQQIKFSSFFIRQTASLPMARGACQRAFQDRKKDATPEYDSFKELTEENMQKLCDNASYKYYFSDKKNIDGEEKIVDESALINVNLVSSDVLKRLPGLDENLARNITESIRRPFMHKNEVLLAEGITKDAYNQFKDLITVCGTGKININTVSGEVLSALSLDEELINTIMRYRKEYIGADEKEGTEDDGAFTNPATILSDLKKFSNLSLKQEQDLLSITNYLNVKSEYLRFSIIPQVKGKDGIRYSLVINPAENKIISWLEH